MNQFTTTICGKELIAGKMYSITNINVCILFFLKKSSLHVCYDHYDFIDQTAKSYEIPEIISSFNGRKIIVHNTEISALNLFIDKYIKCYNIPLTINDVYIISASKNNAYITKDLNSNVVRLYTYAEDGLHINTFLNYHIDYILSIIQRIKSREGILYEHTKLIPGYSIGGYNIFITNIFRRTVIIGYTTIKFKDILLLELFLKKELTVQNNS